MIFKSLIKQNIEKPIGDIFFTLIVDEGTDKARFKNHANISYTGVEIERLFSQLKLVKTDKRSNLKNDTLETLLLKI